MILKAHDMILKARDMILKVHDMILKVHDMILKVRCDDIKLGNAICGGNWQPLNIIFFGETFAKNIIVYVIFRILRSML